MHQNIGRKNVCTKKSLVKKTGSDIIRFFGDNIDILSVDFDNINLDNVNFD